MRQGYPTGVTRLNQWLKPLKRGTGSNLVDAGRAAVRAEPTEGEATPMPVTQTGQEAMGKACGVPMAMLQIRRLSPVGAVDTRSTIWSSPTPFGPAVRITPTSDRALEIGCVCTTTLMAQMTAMAANARNKITSIYLKKTAPPSIR